MNLRTRIARLKKRDNAGYNRISMAVLDRILDGSISEQAFNRWVPLFEEILANLSKDGLNLASDNAK